MPSFKGFIRALIGADAKGYYGIPVARSRSQEKLNWTGAEFLDAYKYALYMNRAIAKRGEKVGEIEFSLKDDRGREIENDPLIDLLYKPNSYMTGAEFWSLFQVHKDLFGSAYFWKELNENSFAARKVPTALHLLRPDRVEKVIKDARVEKYIYTRPDGGKTTFTPDQVFCSYYPDPEDFFFGLPLIKAASNAIDTELQVERYQRNIIANGGRIPGVFKFKDKLNPAQRAEAKQSLRSEIRQARTDNMPLLLSGDSSYENLALTPQELGWTETKKSTLEDISIATGVPKSILASFDEVKFDNADSAQAVFLSETIRPLLKNLTQKLDEFFFPDGKNLSFIDPTPANTDKILKQIDSGVKNFYMTRNEARELAGLESLPDGDVILVPFSLIPADAVPDVMANPQGDPEAKKKIAKTNFVHPLSDPFVRKRYGDMRDRRMQRLEVAFKAGVEAFFNAQKKRLISQLGNDQRAPDEDDIVIKGLLSDAFDFTLEQKLTGSVLLPLLRKVIEAGGSDAFELFDVDSTFRMTVDTDAWLNNRASTLGKDLTDTTYDKLKEAFKIPEDGREDRNALINRIEDTYEGFTTTRAITIARTEVHGAYQQGTSDGYKQAGVPIKIWVSVADQNTRDAHLEADGQEVPMTDSFNVGGEMLEYPGDPSGSPDNTINCRCVI